MARVLVEARRRSDGLRPNWSSGVSARLFFLDLVAR
jgi:hypothetical protein